MKILIVEDQAMFREMLRGICASARHEVVGEAGDGKTAVALVAQTAVDVVLLDLELPVMDGFAVIEALQARGAAPKILVLSSFCDDYTVLRIERAQIQGFVDKSTSAGTALLEALAALAAGNTYFSSTFRSVREARRKRTDSFDKVLSDREQQVLALIGQLRSDDEVAVELGIQPRTAESHRFNIMKKLGIDTRLELERYARDHGFTKSVVKGQPGSGRR